jgi:hypothetical protein
MKERHVRDDFLRAGATMPVNAMSLADIGIGESMAFKRLVRRSIIREASPGLFYFDEEVYLSVRAMRRRMALVMLVTIVLLFLFVTFVRAR